MKFGLPGRDSDRVRADGISSSGHWKVKVVSMKKRQRVALVLAGLAVFLATAGAHYLEQKRLTAAAEGFDGKRAFGDLQRLVALGPRPPGSPALDEARRYIADELGDAGVEISYDSFVAATPKGKVAMRNIIGRLPGVRSEVVVIAGHYDTARLPGVSFVGANDGGSSASELLELARVLSRRSHALTYWLVFFDGEEALERWSESDSLYGSRHFIETQRKDGRLTRVRAMLLVDMVAGRDPQFRPEADSTPWLRELLFSCSHRLGYRDAFSGKSPLRVEDDHLPFLAAGAPAVDIIDFAPFVRGYHHTAQDTLERCNPDTLTMVGRVVLAMLAELDRRLSS